ncbi:DUF6702 family protein [Aquimarina algicola]|uniref:Peptidase E n=1 Tax=Aquimarina algicola TaxID=2589995 RepID=A0A504ITJ4_9FLAO|nr:DUF6702 family protein [Aquimarina algicola]TPN81656.1 hypothetical protein FHK87_23940 [Aquimarina algicola]
MKKLFTVIFCILFSLGLNSFTTVHKFYVSVTQIDYNEEQNALQMITRVFIDDIEELLKERYDTSISIDTKESDVKIDQYLNTYFNQKLSCIVNGQKVTFTFIGKEYEEDLMLCYLEIENINKLQSIEVSNEILMDVFEEQQNIIHVKKGKQRKSLILEKGNHSGLLKFSE